MLLLYRQLNTRESVMERISKQKGFTNEVKAHNVLDSDSPNI